MMSLASDGWIRVITRKYQRFGISVSFISPVEAQEVTLTMVDLTKGVETGDGFAQVASITPVAAVRRSDLTDLGIAPGDMMDVCFTLNGGNWQIKSFAPKPSPFGEGMGEIYFMLEAV